MITATNLKIGYKGREVHPGLTFSLKEGELVCLMGLNGAGKSTLIKTLCGTLNPLGGDLTVEGVIGVVLTEKTNAGGLSVYDLVSLGRYRQSGFFGKLSKADHEAVREALRAVGMEHKSESHVSQLSDGERQKAFIAKALAQECDTMILDEPTAFLDVRSRRETMELLRELAHEKGKAVLVSTHDLDLAKTYSDRIWLLSPESPLITDGDPDEFFE